jgi:hypothetical protein
MKKAKLKMRLSWQDLHVIKNKGEKECPKNEISMTPTRRSPGVGNRCNPGMKRKMGNYPQDFAIDMKFDIVGAR